MHSCADSETVAHTKRSHRLADQPVATVHIYEADEEAFGAVAVRLSNVFHRNVATVHKPFLNQLLSMYVYIFGSARIICRIGVFTEPEVRG